MAIDVSLRENLLRPNLGLKSESLFAKTEKSGEKLTFSTKSKMQLNSSLKPISLENSLLKGPDVKSFNLKSSFGCQEIRDFFLSFLISYKKRQNRANQSAN